MASKTQTRIAIAVSTALGSYLRSVILMFGLAYATPLYPWMVGLFGIGITAAFGLRLGIELDPMLILLGGIINIFDGEIDGRYAWSIALIFINMALAAVFSILGGLTFVLLNNNVLLPANLVPAQYLPGGWWIHLFVFIIFPLALYIVFALINVFTRDGYGAIPARFFMHMAAGGVLFFIARDPLDYGLTIAAYLAAQTPLAFTDWFLILIGELIAVGLTVLLWWLLWQPRASRQFKLQEDCGDAVCLNHVIGVIGDDCPLPADYALYRKNKTAIDRYLKDMQKDDTTAVPMDAESSFYVGRGGGMKAL